jgi:succinate-semialdehyde dehydrogenase / glutarate-semialdehyde dehydrogenase
MHHFGEDGPMTIQTMNPATGKIEKIFDEQTLQEVCGLLDKSHAAFLQWRETGFEIRSKALNKAATILRDGKEHFSGLITREMGKPVTQAIAEVEKCAAACDYYAVHAAEILGREVVATDASESYVRFDPLGVVLAVMPWNFPFWQVFRFAAPALMAGNACVLKHASNVPLCALAIEDIFRQAGLPEHAFTTLLIGAGLVAEVIAHPYVRAATLTGSDAAGRRIAQDCGSHLKKTVLELGGSDPFIVLQDANLDDAVKTAVASRLLNNGQSCIAAKRFIIVEKVYDAFQARFVEAMNNVIVGSPMDTSTQLGPMAREDLLDELHGQVQHSLAQGAELLCGGRRIEREGFFYAPTVLARLKKGMPAYDDELFGPVAGLIRARDQDEAVAIANDSQFGLGASVWSADTGRARNLAAKIESGSVFINGMVKSDPRLPFGGIKNSGYGRELSHYGIKEFVNIKTVWVR